MIVNGVLRRRLRLRRRRRCIVGISVPAAAGPGDRARHPRHRLLVHRARADDRRASGSSSAGHGDALEHRLRDAARLLRRERRARRPARLDVDDRPGAAADARDRGGTEARRRRLVPDVGGLRRGRGAGRRCSGGWSATRRSACSSGRAASTRRWSGHERGCASSWSGSGSTSRLSPTPCSSCSRRSSCPCSSRPSPTTCSRPATSRGRLLYVSLGAAVYGIWSSTLFGSGGAIQWQRWQGTLEVLVSAPTPFVLVIAAADARDLGDRRSTRSRRRWSGVGSSSGSRSTSSTGLRSSSRCRRRSSGSGCSGFVFASTFVLYRNANALSNMLEWPVLLVTGHARAALAPPRLGRARSRGCSRRPGACRRCSRGGDSAARRGRTSA